MSLPASAKIALIFSMHNEVLYWIVPEGRSPEGRAGSWPETNMPRGVEMAWDYKLRGQC